MKAISWSWTPMLAIGCALIANAVMIAVALGARVDSVAGVRPGTGARDTGVAARQAFARLGGRLDVAPRPDGAVLAYAGGPLREVVIACERPADARLDRRAAWGDPSIPLAIALPTGGRWSFRLSAIDAAGARVEHVEEVMLP